jgi:hypothetical protein
MMGRNQGIGGYFELAGLPAILKLESDLFQGFPVFIELGFGDSQASEKPINHL